MRVVEFRCKHDPPFVIAWVDDEIFELSGVPRVNAQRDLLETTQSPYHRLPDCGTGIVEPSEKVSIEPPCVQEGYVQRVASESWRPEGQDHGHEVIRPALSAEGELREQCKIWQEPLSILL